MAINKVGGIKFLKVEFRVKTGEGLVITWEKMNRRGFQYPQALPRPLQNKKRYESPNQSSLDLITVVSSACHGDFRRLALVSLVSLVAG
jgi:hypothetical protein